MDDKSDDKTEDTTEDIIDDKSDDPLEVLNQLLDTRSDCNLIITELNEDINRLAFNWTKNVKLINESKDDFNTTRDNCLRGCKWSPDGSCLLTNSEDHCLRLYNLPQNLCQKSIVLYEESEEIKSVLNIKESEIIYDFCWFPKMLSTDPQTCFLMSTSRHNPIHLWDAYTGRLVSTYRPYNYADEVISANSIAFSPDGNKIYSGFEKWIRVFDTSCPGRVCQSKPTYFDKTGQKGIISCVAINPLNPKVLAFGSYDRTIGLYNETDLTNICVIVGQKGGLTHIQFSSDGNRLYSGGRRDSEILCWDIRNIGRVLYVIHREVNTNQRIYFDLTVDSNHLMTGNDSGFVSVYDISGEVTEDVLKPIKQFEAHSDCVNGLSIHPTLPLVSTTSGQRRFADMSDSEDEDLSLSKHTQENSLKFWWV